MKKLFFFLLIMQCTISSRVFSQASGSGSNGVVADGSRGIKSGMAAPDFTGKDQNGNAVSLSQYKGKKVVLYFYPKDDTPGCTAEACSLRDNYDSLTRSGYTILGVSTDDQTSHTNFKEKYHLPFTLIADVDTSINKLYNVWVEKERDGNKYWGTARTTFVINEKGIIVNKIDKVDTKQHAHQILSFDPGQ
jgi:peroxiredoxin Q/BCP